MKSTGIIRRIDELGRIVIPKEILNTRDIKGGSKGTGTPMEIFVDGQDIILKKYSPGCHYCGEVDDNPIQVFNKFVCAKCFEDVKKQIALIDKLRGELND